MVKIALAPAGSAEQAEDADPAENTSQAAPTGSEPSSLAESNVDADPVVAVLIPAARAAAAALHSQRRRVTRKALAGTLSANLGHRTFIGSTERTNPTVGPLTTGACFLSNASKRQWGHPMSAGLGNRGPIGTRTLGRG
jgi:hypothetical protein